MTLDERYEALGGAVSYRELAAGAAVWLTREHVRTPDARDRLLAWVTAGGLHRPAPEIRDTVRYYGDHVVLPAVVDALTAMAPPARDFVLAQASIVATGAETNGWTSGTPAGPRLIVLSAERPRQTLTRTMLHEAAHVWLEATPSGPLPAAGKHDLLALAQREGWADDQRTWVRSVESRAIALAAVWEKQL